MLKCSVAKGFRSFYLTVVNKKALTFNSVQRILYKVRLLFKKLYLQ
jgi:hypothetical protein